MWCSPALGSNRISQQKIKYIYTFTFTSRRCLNLQETESRGRSVCKTRVASCWVINHCISDNSLPGNVLSSQDNLTTLLSRHLHLVSSEGRKFSFFYCLQLRNYTWKISVRKWLCIQRYSVVGFSFSSTCLLSMIWLVCKWIKHF